MSQDLIVQLTHEDVELLATTNPEVGEAGQGDAARKASLANLFKKSVFVFLLSPPLLTLPLALKAENYGLEVRVRVQIAGQGDAKNIPKQYEVRTENSEDETSKAEWVDISEKANYQTLRHALFQKRSKTLQPVKDSPRINYVEVSIRQLPGEVLYKEEAFRPVLVRFINCGDLPSSRRVELTGIVTDDEKRNLTLFVYKVQPIELSFESYKPSEVDKANFRRYFQNNPNLREDLDRTIAPYIVGRGDAKLAAALTLHSPLWLRVDGRIIRGGIITLYVGDSTNGKSAIMEWCHDKLKIGEKAVGESASRAGISYSVDPEHDLIRWGTLVLADGTIAYLDGMQGFPPEELPQLREVLRSWKVVVTKKVGGEAWARDRILAAANPRKAMRDGYTDRAEALLDIASMTDPQVELTRFDLIIPFVTEDVPADLIANATVSPPAIPVDVLQKHVYWTLNLKPDDVILDPNTTAATRGEFPRLMEVSTPRIPLVHNGFMETIERISAAFAVLRHNVADDGKVHVTEQHVKEALAFIEENLERWEYPALVRRLEKVAELSDEEVQSIKEEFAADLSLRRAYEEIRDHPGITTGVLASKLLERSKRNTIDKTNRLKALGLIEAQPRRPGVRLSPKGNTFHKRTKDESQASSGGPLAIQAQLARGNPAENHLDKLTLRKIEELESEDGFADREKILASEDAQLSKWTLADREEKLDRLKKYGLIYEPSPGRIHSIDTRHPPHPPPPETADHTVAKEKVVEQAPHQPNLSPEILQGDPNRSLNLDSKTAQSATVPEPGLWPPFVATENCSVCGKLGPVRAGCDAFLRCQECHEKQPTDEGRK
ncbi:MAG TPA: hypothetical protein VGS11_04455 [Candidatus Bathyarchaeia archaeon]|nr:hypothetical protein [Candidatus Bathyarchaeia archaeon]